MPPSSTDRAGPALPTAVNPANPATPATPATPALPALPAFRTSSADPHPGDARHSIMAIRRSSGSLRGSNERAGLNAFGSLSSPLNPSGNQYQPLDSDSDSEESISELIARKKAEKETAIARSGSRDGPTGTINNEGRRGGPQFTNVNRRLFRASDLAPSSPLARSATTASSPDEHGSVVRDASPMDLEDASEGHDKGKGKALAPEPTSSSKQQNLAGIKQPIRIVVKPNGSAVIECDPGAETSTDKQDDRIVAVPKRPIRIVVKPKQANATAEDAPSAEAAATEQDHQTTRKIPKKPTTKRKKEPMLEQHAATPGPSRPREIRPRAVPEAIPEPVHEPVSEPVFEPASEMPAFERPNLQRPEIPIQDIGGYSFLPLTFDEGANFGRVWCPLNLRGEPEAHWKVFPPNKNYPTIPGQGTCTIPDVTLLPDTALPGHTHAAIAQQSREGTLFANTANHLAETTWALNNYKNHGYNFLSDPNRHSTPAWMRTPQQQQQHRDPSPSPFTSHNDPFMGATAARIGNNYGNSNDHNPVLDPNINIPPPALPCTIRGGSAMPNYRAMMSGETILQAYRGNEAAVQEDVVTAGLNRELERAGAAMKWVDLIGGGHKTSVLVDHTQYEWGLEGVPEFEGEDDFNEYMGGRGVEAAAGAVEGQGLGSGDQTGGQDNDGYIQNQNQNHSSSSHLLSVVDKGKGKEVVRDVDMNEELGFTPMWDDYVDLDNMFVDKEGEAAQASAPASSYENQPGEESEEDSTLQSRPMDKGKQPAKAVTYNDHIDFDNMDWDREVQEARAASAAASASAPDNQPEDQDEPEDQDVSGLISRLGRHMDDWNADDGGFLAADPVMLRHPNYIAAEAARRTGWLGYWNPNVLNGVRREAEEVLVYEENAEAEL